VNDERTKLSDKLACTKINRPMHEAEDK